MLENVVVFMVSMPIWWASLHRPPQIWCRCVLNAGECSRVFGVHANMVGLSAQTTANMVQVCKWRSELVLKLIACSCLE